MSWVMNSSVMPSSRTSCVEQRDDLGLHDRVERAGRLVGDQQPGSGGDGRRDRDALALAAGELVRIGCSALSRVGNADPLEQAQRRCGRLRASPCRDGVCATSAICSPTVSTGFEAGAGVLEDEADVAAVARARGRAPASRCCPDSSHRPAAARQAPAPACSCPSRSRRSRASRSPATMSSVDGRERCARRRRPRRDIATGCASNGAHPRALPSRQRLGQAFGDQVDAEHGQDQRDAGDDRQERRGAQHVAALGDHRAPGHAVGVAEAEEGQRRLDQDGAGDDDRASAPAPAAARSAGPRASAISSGCMPIDARGGDVVALADRQHFGAGEARRAGPGAERDGERRRPASDGPTTLTKASASRKLGTVWKASVMRISTSSTRPPAKPASVPTSAPIDERDDRGGEPDGQRGARRHGPARPARRGRAGRCRAAATQSWKGGSSGGPAMAQRIARERRRRRKQRHQQPAAPEQRQADRAFGRAQQALASTLMPPASVAPTRGSSSA